MRSWSGLVATVRLLLLLVWTGIACAKGKTPSSIHLRAGVLDAPPFAWTRSPTGQVEFGGFQVELLERLQAFARDDNVTLTFELSESPPQYGDALDLVANDCNTSVNENYLEDCRKFDLIVGDYYCNPARSVRVDFTPSWLRTTMSTIKYLDKAPTSLDFTTLTQADQAGASVCVPDGTYLMSVVMAKFPNAQFAKCNGYVECLEWLKQEKCVLYADDELMLQYRQSQDPSLEVTREQFNTQYLVWPMTYSLPPIHSLLIKKWLYAAVSNATLDELYSKYFQKSLCPIGTAGKDCELPCDPKHGNADAKGQCVCESVKWTGPDCSIEVQEDKNLIPTTLKYIAFAMFGINATAIFLCGLWLIWQQDSPQVRVSQPSFLFLVLLGCLISSGTILVMAQEDEGDGPVLACMAIPWLYSVGFSITFGTLFAKIRRVYLIFMKAADAHLGDSGQRKKRVTFKETLSVIAGVLLVDVLILTVWTVTDPLHWSRHIIAADQFGVPLESEGFCKSDHWPIFAGLIASLHLLLMAVACFMCYVARGIPSKFSESKYLSIAMISNLQIFVVGLPILFILGSDPQASFFVRSVIIWMNDLAVVALIFGNLMYSVHLEGGDGQVKVQNAMNEAINRYSTAHANRKSSSDQKGAANNTSSFHGSGSRLSGHSSIKSMNEDSRPRIETTTIRSGKPSRHGSKTAKEKPEQSAREPPEDVLKDSRVSWGGVNFSTCEPLGGDDDTSIDDNKHPLGDSCPEREAVYEDEPVQEPEEQKQRPPSLPPSQLPKGRPTHMSYAESRISRIRNSHAKIVSDRKSSRGKSPIRGNGETPR